ncbi:hypothetical protein CYMTET_22213 [Cymbomonas tetramitiformis]|uniref:Uncharacterized protein n=1 Tax=Cymbomonas tetramitiformis TaxID=36881 RepID=A0AAE0G0P9_9CHLO|nr:hypothetical protein CYMTET_22213 [Cymbomonas tetramitiformis]
MAATDRVVSASEPDVSEYIYFAEGVSDLAEVIDAYLTEGCYRYRKQRVSDALHERFESNKFSCGELEKDLFRTEPACYLRNVFFLIRDTYGRHMDRTGFRCLINIMTFEGNKKSVREAGLEYLHAYIGRTNNYAQDIVEATPFIQDSNVLQRAIDNSFSTHNIKNPSQSLRYLVAFYFPTRGVRIYTEVTAEKKLLEALKLIVKEANKETALYVVREIVMCLDGLQVDKHDSPWTSDAPPARTLTMFLRETISMLARFPNCGMSDCQDTCAHIIMCNTLKTMDKVFLVQNAFRGLASRESPVERVIDRCQRANIKHKIVTFMECNDKILKKENQTVLVKTAHSLFQMCDEDINQCEETALKFAEHFETYLQTQHQPILRTHLLIVDELLYNMRDAEPAPLRIAAIHLTKALFGDQRGSVQLLMEYSRSRNVQRSEIMLILAEGCCCDKQVYEVITNYLCDIKYQPLRIEMAKRLTLTIQHLYEVEALAYVLGWNHSHIRDALSRLLNLDNAKINESLLETLRNKLGEHHELYIQARSLERV